MTENTSQETTSTQLTDSIVDAEKKLKAEEIKTTQNTTKVQLPSNGLINPDITEVTLRRMTVKESKTLYTSNDPDFLATLVTGCIIEPINITTRDLHPNDILYLSFILRYISSPNQLEQKSVCTNPRCRKSFTYKVDIPSLKVNYATPEKYVMTVTLPDKKDLLKFQVLSEYQITNCEKIAARKVRQEQIDDEDWYTFISKIAYMITEINNEPHPDVEEKIKYLESLSAYDFDTFNKAVNDITSTFGLDYSFFTECPHCHEAIEVQAYIAPDFFQLVKTQK